MRASLFRSLPPRHEAISGGAAFCRHRHRAGYVSIVLSGGFEEAGDHGRRRTGPGDILIHAPFGAHAERAMQTTRMLNFALPAGYLPSVAHGVIEDPDAVASVAQNSPAEALRSVLASMCPFEPTPQDWPDLLARELRLSRVDSLQHWAHAHGVHPAGLARGFAQLYGISPSGYRMEQRAYRAWHAIITTREPLTGIAHDIGFADQAHMSRAVKSLTGCPPTTWRRLNAFKTVGDRVDLLAQ